MAHYKNLSLNNIVYNADGKIVTEIWKSIIGYEEIYEVSSFVRIKSLARKTWTYKGYIQRKTKCLKQFQE
jgi:hypothetical protein